MFGLIDVALIWKRLEEGRGRAPEIGMYKGSASRPRSFSTYIMGAGMLLMFIAIFTLQFLLFLPGAGLLALGFLAAILEAIFDK